MRLKAWFWESVSHGATLYRCHSCSEWRPVVIIERGRVYAARKRDAEYREFDTVKQAHEWLGFHDSPWDSDE
jgi:hypothetical protein